MPENRIPTFDQCEKVYQVLPALGKIIPGVLLMAALVVHLTVLAVRDAAPGRVGWILFACAALAVLLGLCGTAIAGTRIGIHADGVLVRVWPWGRRFIRFDEIIGLEDKSAVTARDAKPYSRQLTARVQVDRDQARCVKISGMDEITDRHAWAHLDAIRDTIISRCALRDLGDAVSCREKIRRRKRSSIVVVWTVRRWYPPREEPIRILFKSDTPSTLDECDRIYGIARNGGRHVRRIGLCESGIVIDDTRDGMEAHKWADVTGLVGEVEQGRFLWPGFYRSLYLLLGDPRDGSAVSRAMLMRLDREPLEAQLRAFGQLREYLCVTLDLSYAEQFSTLSVADLDAADMEGSVTWVRT